MFGALLWVIRHSGASFNVAAGILLTLVLATEVLQLWLPHRAGFTDRSGDRAGSRCVVSLHAAPAAACFQQAGLFPDAGTTFELLAVQHCTRGVREVLAGHGIATGLRIDQQLQIVTVGRGAITHGAFRIL